jgi:hypothetical protein
VEETTQERVTMQQRVTIILDEPDATALQDIAHRLDRDVRRQATVLLREAIRNCGTDQPLVGMPSSRGDDGGDHACTN